MPARRCSRKSPLSPASARMIVPAPRSAPTNSAAAIPCPCREPQRTPSPSCMHCSVPSNPSALRAGGTFDRRTDRETLRQQLSERGRGSRAGGCHSGRRAGCDGPRALEGLRTALARRSTERTRWLRGTRDYRLRRELRSDARRVQGDAAARCPIHRNLEG